MQTSDLPADRITKRRGITRSGTGIPAGPRISDRASHLSPYLLPALALAMLICGRPVSLVTQDDHATLLAEATMIEAQDDPASTLYRDGYNDVLAERWTQAREKFSSLIKRYPRSTYLDDAEYWRAYAWRTDSPRRAMELYRSLIEKYPKSPYLDDAVADLTQLEIQAELSRLPGVPVPVDAPAEFQFNFRLPEEMRRLEKEMSRVRTNLRSTVMGRMVVVPSFTGDSLQSISVPVITYEFSAPAADPHLRVRVEAIRALGANQDDGKTFTTLKQVALDGRQPFPVRNEAMRSLVAFTRFDAKPVYRELARTDTNEAVRSTAVSLFGAYLQHTAKNKSDALKELEDLFGSMPSSRTRERGTLLYTIASVGDDRAVDFLIKVARGSDDVNLRSDAIYYLGSIGNEKARTALQEILLGR